MAFSLFRAHKYVIMKVDGMPHPPSKGPRHVVGKGEGLQALCPWLGGDQGLDGWAFHLKVKPLQVAFKCESSGR